MSSSFSGSVPLAFVSIFIFISIWWSLVAQNSQHTKKQTTILSNAFKHRNCKIEIFTPFHIESTFCVVSFSFFLFLFLFLGDEQNGKCQVRNRCRNEIDSGNYFPILHRGNLTTFFLFIEMNNSWQWQRYVCGSSPTWMPTAKIA